MSEPSVEPAGLCARCAHARVIVTPRSRFILCGLSRDDARFDRYPRLPVRTCAGHQPLAEGAEVQEGPPPRE